MNRVKLFLLMKDCEINGFDLNPTNKVDKFHLIYNYLNIKETYSIQIKHKNKVNSFLLKFHCT